ncbi:hypothetical protein [Streptomyces sp. NPDC007369]|uniref:hypothetical protein n=1 Tax=Streptomyces sp. NPDC007369 TaxID=3154589 RepID=UPI0033FC64E3
MTRAHNTHHHPLPAPPEGPSDELADRAADGFCRFMARWDGVDPDPGDERPADSTRTGER